MTFIFLDWDNTIIPTNYLGENGYLLVEEKGEAPKYIGAQDFLPFSKEYEIYLSCVCNFLSSIRRRGFLVILTGSQPDWIEQTKRFLGIRGEEILKNIECVYTNNKIKSMEIIIRGFENLIDNVISIGDGMQERAGIMRLRTQSPRYNCKSIGLAINPSVETITREQNMIIAKLDEIISYPCHFDQKLFELKLHDDIFITDEDEEERSKSAPVDCPT